MFVTREANSQETSGLAAGVDTIYDINQPSESPTKLGFMSKQCNAADYSKELGISLDIRVANHQVHAIESKNNSPNKNYHAWSVQELLEESSIPDLAPRLIINKCQLEAPADFHKTIFTSGLNSPTDLSSAQPSPSKTPSLTP